jgi:hypothetical protein
MTKPEEEAKLLPMHPQKMQYKVINQNFRYDIWKKYSKSDK